MFSCQRKKEVLSKNFITEQNYFGFINKLNTKNMKFNVDEGYGATDTNSSVILLFAAGMQNQKVVGELKWVAPSDADNHEIGVMARCVVFDSSPSYYYACIDGGVAKLTKVVGGSFKNLSTNAFAVPIDTPVTISLSCVDSTITAVFTCGGVAGSPLTLSVSDSDITGGGIVGMRSLSSAVWFRSCVVECLDVSKTIFRG